MSEVIFVPSVFSAIKQLEELEFARSGFDKELGHVEWRNRKGDRAEIFWNKDLKRWTIGIDNDLWKQSLLMKGARMGKNGNGDGGDKSGPTPQEQARQENADKAFEALEKEVSKESGTPGRDSDWGNEKK